MLVITVFFLAWDAASGGSKAGAIDRVLTAGGSTVALLLALVLVPIANGLGLRAPEYIRYATLPVSARQLLRRMALFGMSGAALLGFAVPITWALAVQPDVGVAVAFAVGVACLQVAALGVYLTLITVWWPVWQRVGSLLPLAWIVVPAAVLIGQFGMLRAHPQRLASLAVIEIAASLFAAGMAWVAIGRMVDTREPTAGF